MRLLQLASAYGFINPHLRLTISGSGGHETEASDRLWQKWKPSDPTSSRWYRPENLERLLGAYLSHDAERGRERTVREFIAEFRGLSGTAKQKAVLEATGLARAPLSRLLNSKNAFDRDAVEALLQAMAANSKPGRPEALGIIGVDHLRTKFETAGCAMDTFRCKTVKGTTDGVPWVIEAAFAWRPENPPGQDGRYTTRQLITGVNWSPGIVNPFRSLGYGRSLESLLAEKFAAGAGGGAGPPCLSAGHLHRPRKVGDRDEQQGRCRRLARCGDRRHQILDPPAKGGAARPVAPDQPSRCARPTTPGDDQGGRLAGHGRGLPACFGRRPAPGQRKTDHVRRAAGHPPAHRARSA